MRPIDTHYRVQSLIAIACVCFLGLAIFGCGGRPSVHSNPPAICAPWVKIETFRSDITYGQLEKFISGTQGVPKYSNVSLSSGLNEAATKLLGLYNEAYQVRPPTISADIALFRRRAKVLLNPIISSGPEGFLPVSQLAASAQITRSRERIRKYMRLHCEADGS